MKKIMHILFLSCVKATELIEKKFLFKLSLKEKIQLSLHKMVCNACSNYEKQNMIIEKAVEKHMLKSKKLENIDLNQFEKSILEKLGKK